MANSGRDPNGSQFFIMFRPDLRLDGLNEDGTPKDCTPPGTPRALAVSCHAVFGKVIEGMDVVNAITLREPSTATFKGDVIMTITIDES